MARSESFSSPLARLGVAALHCDDADDSVALDVDAGALPSRDAPFVDKEHETGTVVPSADPPKSMRSTMLAAPIRSHRFISFSADPVASDGQPGTKAFRRSGPEMR